MGGSGGMPPSFWKYLIALLVLGGVATMAVLGTIVYEKYDTGKLVTKSNMDDALNSKVGREALNAAFGEEKDFDEDANVSVVVRDGDRVIVVPLEDAVFALIAKYLSNTTTADLFRSALLDIAEGANETNTVTETARVVVADGDTVSVLQTTALLGADGLSWDECPSPVFTDYPVAPTYAAASTSTTSAGGVSRTRFEGWFRAGTGVGRNGTVVNSWQNGGADTTWSMVTMDDDNQTLEYLAADADFMGHPSIVFDAPIVEGEPSGPYMVSNVTGKVRRHANTPVHAFIVGVGTPDRDAGQPWEPLVRIFDPVLEEDGEGQGQQLNLKLRACPSSGADTVWSAQAQGSSTFTRNMFRESTWCLSVPYTFYFSSGVRNGSSYDPDFVVGFQNEWAWRSAVTRSNFTAGSNETTLFFGNDGARTLKGKIAEVIVGDANLTLAEMEKVASYLGIKYGRAPTGINLTLSDGTLVWPAMEGQEHNSEDGVVHWSKVSRFRGNTIVLARDDAGGLNVRHAYSTEGNMRGVFMQMGSNPATPGNFPSDLSFVAARPADVGLITTYRGRSSAFKVRASSGNHIVTVGFDKNVTVQGLRFEGYYSSDLQIEEGYDMVLVSNSSDMSNPTYYALSQASSRVYATITLRSGQYFAFAAQNRCNELIRVELHSRGVSFDYWGDDFDYDATGILPRTCDYMMQMWPWARVPNSSPRRGVFYTNPAFGLWANIRLMSDGIPGSLLREMFVGQPAIDSVGPYAMVCPDAP